MPSESATEGERFFAIYLKDHHAGSTGGLELAKRTAGSNRENEFGTPLAQLAAEINEDRRELERLMGRLGVDPDRLKSSLAWTLEKLGRLKLNGQLTGYSPLSRLVEIEGLISGVNGKLSLWRNLLDIAAGEPRLDPADLDRLAERAESQLETLHELRARAALQAFAAR
jgi:hypothetical protein